MATINHVDPNSVASSTHQNGLIDQVNANTTNIGTRGARLELYTEVNNTWTVLNEHEARLDTIDNPPKCSVYVANSGYQTLSYMTNTMMLWEAQAIDSHNMFTPGQSGITVPAAGTYMSVTSINLAKITGTVTGAIGVKLLKNSATADPGGANEVNVLATNTAPFNVADEGPVVNMSVPVYLNAGDTLRVSAWHNFAVGGTGQNVAVWRGFNAKGTKWDLVYLGK